jgi:hypothetical protein
MTCFPARHGYVADQAHQRTRRSRAAELGRWASSIVYVRFDVPSVRKAVKCNSPLYGVEGQGWFLSFRVFTHYVKLTFFRGTSLRPVPPGVSRSKDTRYLDIREGDKLKEAQMAMWVKQAAALPGWTPQAPVHGASGDLGPAILPDRAIGALATAQCRLTPGSGRGATACGTAHHHPFSQEAARS